MDPDARFRQLPSVDELARALSNLESRFPRALIVAECRRTLEHARQVLREGAPAPPDLASRAAASLESLLRPSLLRVINATGVILHTNLGRAPLPSAPTAETYSNLEYDLHAGRRGQRDAHTAALLHRLLDAPAILVNNGAAAVYLALHELAAGGEVVISRGELIEIGDGFRIPDIMAHSGARVVEIGTTNRTHIDDYRAAITPDTRLLMRVHPSNFRIEGFTGRPALEELVALGRERGIPVYEDLGSGCLVDLSPWGVQEPVAQASLRAGVGIVSFSGDKLLGGPQAGVLAGRPDLVARLRRNPMFRALRVDKMTVAVMETALRALLLERWHDLPVLRMIRQTREEVRWRAAAFVQTYAIADATLIDGESMLGGGSTPQQTLPTTLISFDRDAVALERALRASHPPVIARIDDDRLLVDLRTVHPREEEALAAALRAALSAVGD
ncbi:MAG: L-seryl-tRNA(Sec) selenium transferase [Bryobacteraceae bacterium]